jgi:molecular chaperone GrpE
MQGDDASGKSEENSDQPQDGAVNAPDGAQAPVEAELIQPEIEDDAPEEVAEVHILEPNPAEVARKQADDLAAKLRTVSKAYTDLQEEMDAFRQRQMQLADVKAQRKAGEVVEAFFEPVQNLKRCLETSGQDVESVRQGIEMVLTQFASRMDKLGLREVPGVGSRFDPAVHNALALQPVQEKEQDGIVLLVHAVGYAVGSRVIQPAQVVIGKFEETTITEA